MSIRGSGIFCFLCFLFAVCLPFDISSALIFSMNCRCISLYADVCTVEEELNKNMYPDIQMLIVLVLLLLLGCIYFANLSSVSDRVS